MNRLLLWDIDGTLISLGEIAHHPFHDALREVLGYEPDFDGVRFDGKTDPLIVEEILQLNGLDGEELHSTAKRVLRKLPKTTADRREELRENGCELPGVRAVLQALDDHAVINTVLTGNLAVNAVLKLQIFRLTSCFDLEVGAFGSDKRIRAELVQVAIDRVDRLRSHSFKNDDVWIIGDTPRDLETARANEAHCLLVATGTYHFDELRQHAADYVLPDLTDTERVVGILTEG